MACTNHTNKTITQVVQIQVAHMPMMVLGHVLMHTMAMPTGAEVLDFSKIFDLCITTQI